MILLKYWLEVTPDEQTRRLGAGSTTAASLEALADGPEIVQPLVRLFEGARRDVRRDRHVLGTLVRRAIRRQAAGATEHHQPPAGHIAYQQVPREK